MALFDLNSEGKIVLNPDSLALPPFKKIWEQDKSKDKTEATKTITFIYLISDNMSPYMNYPVEIRQEKLIEDLFGKNWKPTTEVLSAVEYYKEISMTTSMRLLYSAKEACHKLADYFEKVDFTELDEEGRQIYSAKDVASNLSSVGKIVESLDTLEEKVKKEITGKTKIRGGGQVGQYER